MNTHKNKFLKLLPLPSDAVKAMIDGLRAAGKRKKFEINMSTYGAIRCDKDGNAIDDICIGCAATCTIQQATGIKFTQVNIISTGKRADITHISFRDLDDFESMVESLRVGMVDELFDFYAKKNKTLEKKIKHLLNTNFSFYEDLPILSTDDWKVRLPEYVKLYKFLLKQGL